jgi:hypothetical protein
VCLAAGSALALLTAAAPAPAASHGYSTRSSAYRADARFAVTYRGSGRYRTVYHSRPPNKGGKPDTNDAHDASTQAWRLSFRRQFAVVPCGPARTGSTDDPCAGSQGLDRARGPTSATGRIDHRHVDGLFRNQNAAVRCRLRRRTRPKGIVAASIGIAYSPDRKTVAVTAYEPVTTLLENFPTACPRQGDSLDGLLDNYFTPGFSFSSKYGPERWFTSRTVQIPADVFHRSSEIRIPLRDTRAGRSPRHCAVQHRSFERCRTGGSWRGVLRFERRP